MTAPEFFGGPAHDHWGRREDLAQGGRKEKVLTKMGPCAFGLTK